MSIEAVQDNSFFDVGLSDFLGAWVSVENEKSKNNMNAFQQGAAQQAAISEPEMRSQNTQLTDVTDVRQGEYIKGVDNRLLYAGGGLLLALVVYKAVS